MLSERFVRCAGISFRHVLAALGMLGASAFAASPLLAEPSDPHAAHGRHMHAGSGASATTVRFPMADLVDSNGHPFRFDPAAFGASVVLIDFVYTTCTTICPVLTATMAAAQRRLAEHLGDQVVLVSVSVDPTTDTPEKLSAYAQRFHAGEHWRWLTGRKGQVDRVLRAFGLTTGAPEEHPPVMLVGRPTENRWLRWVGIPATDSVVGETLAMIEQPAASTPKSSRSGVGGEVE